MFVFPHGIGLDKDGNVYVTDADGNKEGKGHTVVKFSPEGKMLMTLGKVIAFIPEPGLTKDLSDAPEGVAADAMGNVYGAQTNSKNLRKYVKQ
jgi:DNA-binding beta-propeller fold protein YncE